MKHSDAREVFESAKRALNKAFAIPSPDSIEKHVKVSQSTLRLEQLLVAGSGLYQFPLMANQETFSNTETRLVPTDTALVYELGVFVGSPASAIDTAFTLDTYNSPVKYGATPAANLAALWNGNLSLNVNNDILIPKWDLLKHFNAPETQQTAALGSASPMDQFRGSFDGFFPVVPNIILIGGKNNVIQISIPGAGIATVKAFSRLIVIMRCIVAQNSTPTA